MKKILLSVIVTLCVTGCITIKYPTHREMPKFSDFRPYTDNGFFISPGMEGVKYKPIGIIECIFVPGVKKGSSQYRPYREIVTVGGRKPIADSTANNGDNGFFEPTEDYMISRVVDIAKSLGANGLLNYKIEYDFEIPSLISRVLDSDPTTNVIAHPDQSYGSATISVFAVEITEK